MQRFCAFSVVLLFGFVSAAFGIARAQPHRILLDTDVDTDDFFALLYLLKLNRSEFSLEAVTINTNGWSTAGHAVNHVYDMLYMMGRDDMAVGVGGDGGILENGTILPNVGGYLPIVEQGMSTAGGCRYRQVIPKGHQGRLDIDTNFGLRRRFLPQGNRRYIPLQQSTAQQVMKEKISQGPITLLLIGAHTNLAIFLMSNPHLKKNIEHIYVMGGGVRSRKPAGECGDRGNIFTDCTSNPYAEFNMFADPFAAYQVFHSGVPVTLVPLDATNTIPITEKFFKTLQSNSNTYEAQYCFLTLKTVRDTWFHGQFHTSYFMWDSFAAGVATSIMRNSGKNGGENDFAEMEYMNITVVTSNKPYGISDGSNPFFDGRKTPRFNLTKGYVHSGHVQTSLRDPFCTSKNGKGLCQDGYTKEVNSSDGVRVLVATKAKLNKNINSELDREFYRSFLEELNKPQQAGKFDFSSQFPYYKEMLYKPDFGKRKLGKPVVLDMDMSPGDFIALFYLLKVPVELINLKAIIVSSTGWANAATIDVIYDILHMMGRDDIPVGLGDVFAMNQSDPINPLVGNCKYVKAIPQGSGGFLDSDTLYGLGRDLPRSPRRYTAENSAEFGAHRDTDRAELRQPPALEVWQSAVKYLNPVSKVTVLTNGPLTSLAKIILSDKNAASLIQDVYVVGGHIALEGDRGNVFDAVPSNKDAEFNLFLDPLAARTVFQSKLNNITLIPLASQRQISSFETVLSKLRLRRKETPEARFTQSLLSRLYRLQQTHYRYRHMDMFLGEILGAVLLGEEGSVLKPSFSVKSVTVVAEGDESVDGKILIDNRRGRPVRVLEGLDSMAYYDIIVNRLSHRKQSAVIGSFEEQKKMWTTPPIQTVRSAIVRVA